MNSVFKSIKDHIKKMLGRHYEPILRQPYVRLRALKRAIILELPGTLSAGISRFGRNLIRNLIRNRPRPLSLSEEENILIGKVRDLQLKVQSRHNTAILLNLIAALFRHLYLFRIKQLESFYNRHFQNLNKNLAKRYHGVPHHQGLVFVVGTLTAGGSERQVTLTLRGLARRGIKPVGLVVAYLRNQADRFYEPDVTAAGVPVTELCVNQSDDQDTLPTELQEPINELPVALQDVRDYVRAFALPCPDTVHLWLDEINIKGGIAAVIVGVPRIILSGRSLPPNNYHLYQPYMREAYRWLLRQPGVTFINNSTAGARAYEQWLGLSKGSIGVIHNGFDFDDAFLERCRHQRISYRERRGIPSNVPLMGTVIRLSEEKRPLLWAEIAAHIAQAIPDAHFLVVGDGPLRKELEQRAELPDLAGRFHIVGLEKRALEAIAAMDLFLLSSRGEGLPNVLVEAQAVGVPVVTTRVGGAPETLQHGFTGWVLSDDRPERAATEIVRLLKDQAWLRAAAEAGPEFVKNRFGLERMLDETIQLYECRS